MTCFFVRGLSRSGGTLMATILDAHPDVAMSYETYEHLLDSGEEPPHQLDDILQMIGQLGVKSIRRNLFSGSKNVRPEITKFVRRAERAGIDHETLGRLFEKHFDSGLRLDSFQGRMLLVEQLTLEKMWREGKVHWGAKILSVYDQLDEIYPDAKYLFMLRDGRDVAASRKKVGDFKQSISEIASGWCRQIAKFEHFAAGSNGRAFFVPYERMAYEPEAELRKLMANLNLTWNERILSFHTLNLSIHRNATGHLSGKQLKSPISTSSIGRWKEDLTTEEISEFEAKAGQTLEKLGYI